jgi:NADH-ubiquinone oxidoreductase chain 1
LWLFFRNYIIYLVIPYLSLIVAIIIWSTIESLNNYLDFELRLVFLLCCIGGGVYSSLGRGWASNSKYSYLGALRSVAQSISYEVILAIILLRLIFFSFSLSIVIFTKIQKLIWLVYIMFPLFLRWIICFLAELNRTPFDFSEGESELVSGFNVEYRSLIFGVLFIAEYLIIIYMSWLRVLLFFGGQAGSLNVIFLFCVLVFVLWVRGSLPRFRYDFLIYLSWKILLPIILFIIMRIVAVIGMLN